jgi:hypothetical protein
MRTYILTERERRIVKNFLAGKIGLTDPGLSQIRTRLKGPNLVGDLDLLIALRKAITTSTA